MKYVLLVIVSIFVVGCATPITKVNVNGLEQSDVLLVEDLRPEVEKESEILSLLITNDAYGIYRRGDDLLDPSPIRLLQHRLYERTFKEGEKPKLKVHHFIVYMNLQSELRRSATGVALGGIVGAGIASSTQEYGVSGFAELISEEEFQAIPKEYQRATYSEEVNPNKASVYIVYLQADIDGKKQFVKTITPYKLPKESTKNAHAMAVETAIAYFLDTLAEYPGN